MNVESTIHRGLGLLRPRLLPVLEPDFRPAVLANRNFRHAVQGRSIPVRIGLERGEGLISVWDTVVAQDGLPSVRGNFAYLERFLKFLLWSRGGWRVWFGGPPELGQMLRDHYRASRTGKFDAWLMGDKVFETSTEPATLDQKGCQYHPHVVGVQTNQPVKILNSDPTTHNIHPVPANNREWNESQPPQAAPLEKTFAREEIMLPVKCNQHPWMKMYVNVVRNPFFAVTDRDGKYEIKGLPPGDYTLAFVHEKLGEQTQKVTVAAKDSKTVDTSFKQ